MPGLALPAREAGDNGYPQSADQMCRQQSRSRLSPDEQLAAEESFALYCKPVELYNIIQRRSIKNPSFLQRCLHYKIHASRKKRIQITVSLSRGANTEWPEQNAFPLYVLLATPTTNISLEGHSPIYRFSRACLLTSFSESGNEDHTKATFTIPDVKNLTTSRACNLNIILISCVSEGQVGENIGENNCTGDNVEGSALQKLEGKCFWGKIPIDLLGSSLENCVTLNLGHTVELASAVSMSPSFLEPKLLEQDSCLTFCSHKVDATGSYQLQVAISAQEAGARDMSESPYSSYSYSGVPPSSLPHIIRLRAGNVLFNFKYYNNTMQKTEVTEDFACPFCLVKCGSYKGLGCHLNSSHDLFHFEFWISEEYQAVNVSLKIDAWRTELVAEGVDPRHQTFSYCSRFKKRRRLGTTVAKISNVHPHIMDLDSASPKEAQAGSENDFVPREDDDISVARASVDPAHSVHGSPSSPTSPSPPARPRSTHSPSTMAAHSVAAAHATIAARAGAAPTAAAAPSERLGFRLSSLAGRGLRSPLRGAPSSRARRTQRVRASAAVEAVAAAATGELLDKSVNAIRFLAIDAVEKANSGHPGLPMGCAPMGHILYDEVMRYNPKNPYWFNRDRFVLSAGHGCMLQYALLHLAGYDAVKEADLKQFRQWGSSTPGHPENFETPGVEVTTGPLGQGIANAVGLALAEKHLAARFNKPDSEIVDHYTYCIVGDGCNMEGILNEACSLAGHWGLGKLITFYDDNHISIDGDTEIAFTEDVSARFEALGWHTIWVKNGNDGYDEIRKAIQEAKAVTDKPTLIKVTTTIGFGSPNKANSYSVHGAALGTSEVEATRANLGWPYEPFFVPEDVKSHWSRHVPQGAALEADWDAKFAQYEQKYPEDAATLKSIITGELPAGWADALPQYTPESAADATRNLSQQCLNALAPVVPGLIGGSADLASSNMTLLKMFGDFQKDTPEERNVRFGVREHGMGAICNGIALHTPGLIPYCATFFVFTDYMRGAMRISALSEAGVIYVMTHDSIGLGEDGPTHQPIEHLVSFRAMPNILMFRPADGKETAGAYKVAVLNRKRPSILALSRQKLPHLPGTSIEGVAKGGYTISDNSTGNKPDFILLSTGSELEIAVKAGEELTKEGKTVRVVSFVSWELFDEQSDEYKESVLPAAVTARISIEAGSTLGWQKYVGSAGKTIGIDKFGASAPAGIIYKEYGITAENVVAAAKSL